MLQQGGDVLQPLAQRRHAQHDAAQPPNYTKRGLMSRVSQFEAAVSGHVSSIAIAAGATIAAGDVLMVIESMRMEIPLEAESGGVVKAILVQPGDAVAEGQPVVEIE